jgi:hypothetical protein
MGSVLGCKRPRHGANHSPLSRAEVKNEWSYISNASYVFTMCIGKLHIPLPTFNLCTEQFSIMFKSQPTFLPQFFPYCITFDLHHPYTPHFQHKIIHPRVPKTRDTRCLDFTVNVNSKGFQENYTS